jgi:hypothetical protein
MRSYSLAGFCIVTSTLLAGCGGTETPAAQVRSVVGRYYNALESGDGTAACSELTADAREAVVRPLRLFTEKPRHSITCAEVFTFYGKAAASELRETKLGAVKIDGDSATIAVSVPGETAREAPLEKTAAGWRISKLIVRTARPRTPIGG